MKTGRYFKQLCEGANFTKENLEAILQERHEQAVQIGIDETNRVIRELQTAGHGGSLNGYEALPVEIGKAKVGTPFGDLIMLRMEIVVTPPIWHRARLKSGPVNVFKILDTGRKELPKLPSSPNEGSQKGKKHKRKVYLLWSWEGERTLKVPLPVEGRGNRNVRTGRYSYVTGETYVARTPVRKEPRSVKTKLASGETKGLFTKGKLAAVPGRQLYKRVFKNIQKKLRAAGLPDNIVRLS
jgi:hypothetical protein